LHQLSITAGNVALLAGSLVVMVALSPLLALVMVVCIPVFMWVAMRYRNRVAGRATTAQVIDSILARVDSPRSAR
jgi:ABC-type multidrug transport system fused ATPase/permease subunit